MLFRKESYCPTSQYTSWLMTWCCCWIFHDFHRLRTQPGILWNCQRRPRKSIKWRSESKTVVITADNTILWTGRKFKILKNYAQFTDITSGPTGDWSSSKPTKCSPRRCCRGYGYNQNVGIYSNSDCNK
jgi:hypothetical protein